MVRIAPIMTIEAKRERVIAGTGFIAALDQSGGSTPRALSDYGIAEDAYSDRAGMFRLIRDMRARIMTAPTFTSGRIIAAILFERTAYDEIDGMPVPSFLWEKHGIVPFLKIDKGLEVERNGVRLMKPIVGLDASLERAADASIFGTKARSVIRNASPIGIATIVAQQLDIAEQVARHGLLPIIEPEVLIDSSSKAEAEDILLAELTRQIDALPGDWQLMLKLTLPELSDTYASLVAHPRVTRVVALSGGYSRDEAYQRLARNHGLIASFSRALSDGLRYSMNDIEFNETLTNNVNQIFEASIAP